MAEEEVKRADGDRAPTTGLPLPTADVLTEKLGLGEVTSVTSRSDLSKQKLGGMSGEFKFLDVHLATGETLRMVNKGSPALPSAQRKTMGLARESFFYRELAPLLAPTCRIPKCYLAEGSMETGTMSVLLERLDGAIPAGALFGAGNPNNWSIKGQLADIEARCPDGVDAISVTRDAFEIYANLHGRFFGDASLLDHEWLRGSDWYRGEGREGWEAAQGMASAAWAKVQAKLEGQPGGGDEPPHSGKEESSSSISKPTIAWDPHLAACLTASHRKISWDAFQEERTRRPFTLVHGDAHAHNALLQPEDDGGPLSRLSLIDFEMIGVGSPLQELGQWMISHVQPDLRRQHEKGLVRAYHEKLVAAVKAQGKDEAAVPAFEACWAEYVDGGAGRWMWFVPLFTPMPAIGQYFADQLGEFLKDHIAEPADAPMPRV